MATKKNTAIKHGDKEYTYYRITRTIGHEWKDGKKVPIKKQFTGTSKGNAEQKYEEWKKARERESKGINESLNTLGELADFYAENVLAVSSVYAQSTIDRYSDAYKRFKKKDATGLLNKQIGNVASADIQLAYNNFDVHQSSVEALNKFFRGFFKWAVLNRYCVDPLPAVSIPVKTKDKKKDGIVVWNDEELEKILCSLGTYRYRLLVYIAAYAGLRISEILGLQYGDIYNNLFHIKRQYYRGNITVPKYKSFRDIPVHPILQEEIAMHQHWHYAEMKKNGYKTDFMFTTTQGGMLDYTNVKRSLKRFYARNGIPNKSTHTYRATFCTNLCRANVPIQTAAALMGHKSIEVTARFYTFVSQDDKVEAIKLLR